MGSLDRPTSAWPYAAAGGLVGVCFAMLLGTRMPWWAVLAAATVPPLLVLLTERLVRWLT